MLTPDHINPVQWAQAMGYARQSCARVFRDGGKPSDAIEAFGLPRADDATTLDWSRAVDRIAQSLCASMTVRRAA
ncbi:MAG: hypothetical protein NW217_01800 [Hyphomicrobiaceae bacterium]|nr:hypothetical protein [Hyphomicrobiaceae bacterium]